MTTDDSLDGVAGSVEATLAILDGNAGGLRCCRGHDGGLVGGDLVRHGGLHRRFQTGDGVTALGELGTQSAALAERGIGRRLGHLGWFGEGASRSEAVAEFLDHIGGRPGCVEPCASADALPREAGQRVGQLCVTGDRLVDLVDRCLTQRDLLLGLTQSSAGARPLARGSTRRGEVQPELGVDPVDEQRFGPR